MAVTSSPLAMNQRCVTPSSQSTLVGPLSLPKPSRVLRSSEFRETYNRGSRLSTRFFVAFCLRADDIQKPVRFGFTTPRALGKAVVRNRIKRRMREAVRQELVAFPDNWIIVINPRRSVLEAGFADLRCELRRVLAKCK